MHLDFEVRELHFWKQSAVKNSLIDILSFLSDDDWSVEFVRAKQTVGDLGHQNFLPLPRPFSPRYIALYSGGLDSAAGLANNLLDKENGIILVTVGHQVGLHPRIAKQLRQLQGLVKASAGVDFRWLHSTLTTSLIGGKSKRLRQQERTQRTRAFLFCAAAVVAAKEYGISKVQMFENGVGAINLPLMTGMLGSGMATRGAHPTLLRLMSDFATWVTETAIEFQLPFDSKTKGEMLQRLKPVPGMETWLQESRSCIHTSLREVGKTHCGRCAACLERRQAFTSAGINENLNVYQTDALTEKLPDGGEADYLRLYQLDAKRWTEGVPEVNQRLADHLRLTDIPPELDAHIGALQSRHAHEVLQTFGSPFLNQLAVK